MEISISVSLGEIFDKLSILELKKKYIKDENKLSHVKTEFEKILPMVENLLGKNKLLYECLIIVNEKIWKLIDKMKKTDPKEELFNILSFQIYKQNDARFRIKSMIDKQNSSLISEVKSYSKETVIFLGFDTLNPIIKEYYERFLNYYFDDVIYVTSKDKIDSNYYVYDLSSNSDPKYSYLYDTELIQKLSENSQTINYLHSGALGDLIHCMYVVKVNYLTTGKKGNIYLKQEFFTRDLTKTYKDIKNVIEYQEYINKLELYNSQNMDINLDGFRHSPVLYRVDWLVNLSMTFKISLIPMSWIRAPINEINNKIIIGRSVRRQISNFPWEQIVNKNKCSFLTFDMEEYNGFLYKDKVELIKVETFDDMINIIGSCKFYIGNQSAPLAIAYSLGKSCLGELSYPDSMLYMGLEKYHNFMWITHDNNKIDKSILDKFEIYLE